MTRNDLYNFRYIRKEIARVKTRIAECEAAAEMIVAGSGGGSSSGISDKVGNNAAKIVDLKIELENYLHKLEAEERAVVNFISGLKNSRLRLIIQLFFVDCKTWQEVADESGGTENSCKQFFKRKIKELEDMQ